MKKPSEVIREALNNYGITGYKSLYLCHAIYDLDCEEKDKENAIDTFMPIIDSMETSCLTIYLKRINYNGKYKNLVGRYGHETKSTYLLRLQWWNEHLEMLEAKGM